jgi:hypothetical protein
VADDSVDVSEELKGDGLERELAGTLRERVCVVATKTPDGGGSSFQVVDDKGGKVACSMFAATENAQEIAFVQSDVVAELGIEDACRGVARGSARKIVHGGGQEGEGVDVSGQLDDVSRMAVSDRAWRQGTTDTGWARRGRGEYTPSGAVTARSRDSHWARVVGQEDARTRRTSWRMRWTL